MIRNIFILSLSAAIVIAHPVDSNGEGVQYETKCLNQLDFTTDVVDINNVNGKFALVGKNHRWNCMEITFSNATPEDIGRIRRRKDNFTRFSDTKREEAVKKLSFSKDVSDILIWKKENGKAFFLGDDTDEMVSVMFKEYNGNVLFILRGGQGETPIGIQVTKDVTMKCIFVHEQIESYEQEKPDFEVYNFC